MTSDLAGIVERARLAAQPPAADGAGSERARLAQIAQEFEAMLLVQVLRSMRTSGGWATESDGDTLGAESMYETLDVELASHLARTEGLGLSKQLFQSLNGMRPEAGSRDLGSGVRDAGFAFSTSEERPDPGSRTSHPVVGAVRDREVTSSFGWRRDPFTGALKWHRGIDLKAAYGEDVQAAGHGRVVFSGEQGSYGTTVVIEHADGSRTRYAHLSVALVAPGEDVASGQAIGRAGRSGRATGTHVHFEVIGADGRHVDPAGVVRDL